MFQKVFLIFYFAVVNLLLSKTSKILIIAATHSRIHYNLIQIFHSHQAAVKGTDRLEITGKTNASQDEILAIIMKIEH